MTPQQVVDTINEAYDTKVLRIGNRYQGIAKNGMKVNMYLDSNSKIISIPFHSLLINYSITVISLSRTIWI